jgi:hypothetical protein
MSKKLSPMEQEAKMKVLQECMDDMDGMMGEGLDQKKKMKVSVLASSKKGLKEGLEKAKEVVGGDHEMLDEESEEEELSEEELDAKIAELMAKKKSKV